MKVRRVISAPVRILTWFWLEGFRADDRNPQRLRFPLAKVLSELILGSRAIGATAGIVGNERLEDPLCLQVFPRAAALLNMNPLPALQVCERLCGLRA